VNSVSQRVPLTGTQFVRTCSGAENQRKSRDKPIKQLVSEGRVIAPEDLSSSVEEEDAWSGVSSIKYETFADSKTRIIYDMTEEDLNFIEPSKPAKLNFEEIFTNISLERGKTGVYDVEDLVQVLKTQNAIDPVVIEIPRQYRLWTHKVVVSASSQKHSDALAMAVRHVYNRKAGRGDRALILEGRDTCWVAMDMGNIALHIMSPKERERIDLETLWIKGPENDPKVQAAAAEAQEEAAFTLAEDTSDQYVEEAPYDVTKEYIHRYCPTYEDAELPDISQVTDENRNTFSATNNLEMALRRHNGEHSRKFRGRFRK